MPRIELIDRNPNKSDRDRLTDKQWSFIDHYMISKNATLAAKEAGYKPANAAQQGGKLLKNKIISRIIGAREKKQVERLELTSDDVLLQLFYCITRNARDFTDDSGKIITNVNELNDRACAAIDGIDQEVQYAYGPDGEVVGERIKTKLKLVPKAASIDMGMKHKGLFEASIIQGNQAQSLAWDELYVDGSNDPDEIEEMLE
jgi:phage terminase small subunit